MSHYIAGCPRSTVFVQAVGTGVRHRQQLLRKHLPTAGGLDDRHLPWNAPCHEELGTLRVRYAVVHFKVIKQGVTIAIVTIAPEITGPPEDVSGPLYSDLALSCEAKGNPIPDIHWEFKGDNGNSKNLPSKN